MWHVPSYCVQSCGGVGVRSLSQMSLGCVGRRQVGGTLPFWQRKSDSSTGRRESRHDATTLSCTGERNTHSQSRGLTWCMTWSIRKSRFMTGRPERENRLLGGRVRAGAEGRVGRELQWDWMSMREEARAGAGWQEWAGIVMGKRTREKGWRSTAERARGSGDTRVGTGGAAGHQVRCSVWEERVSLGNAANAG